MFFKRTIYLGYYFKQMKWGLLKSFLTFTSKKSGKSKFTLFFESIKSVYKYNISILEYFQFGFYQLSDEEKSTWAGTGTMYEFQLKANPIDKREILENKILFHENYREFFRHEFYTLEELKKNPELISDIYNRHNKVVLKEVKGKTGTGVEVIETNQIPAEKLISYMSKHDYGILESYIHQHEDIQRLSPSAVNTIRVFTQIRKDNTYEVLGCRMRISVDSSVDNMAAGNMAASIDEETGIINGLGVYSDITKPAETTHPITKEKIVGFQIPYWNEILEMVKVASLKHPQNRSIGWDVIVTKDGPGLIEGNHDWCKLVWQLPVNKGLKNRLEEY